MNLDSLVAGLQRKYGNDPRALRDVLDRLLFDDAAITQRQYTQAMGMLGVPGRPSEPEFPSNWMPDEPINIPTSLTQPPPRQADPFMSDMQSRLQARMGKDTGLQFMPNPAGGYYAAVTQGNTPVSQFRIRQEQAGLFLNDQSVRSRMGTDQMEGVVDRLAMVAQRGRELSNTSMGSVLQQEFGVTGGRYHRQGSFYTPAWGGMTASERTWRNPDYSRPFVESEDPFGKVRRQNQDFGYHSLYSDPNLLGGHYARRRDAYEGPNVESTYRSLFGSMWGNQGLVNWKSKEGDPWTTGQKIIKSAQQSGLQDAYLARNAQTGQNLPVYQDFLNQPGVPSGQANIFRYYHTGRQMPEGSAVEIGEPLQAYTSGTIPISVNAGVNPSLNAQTVMGRNRPYYLGGRELASTGDWDETRINPNPQGTRFLGRDIYNVNIEQSVAAAGSMRLINSGSKGFIMGRNPGGAYGAVAQPGEAAYAVAPNIWKNDLAMMKSMLLGTGYTMAERQLRGRGVKEWTQGQLQEEALGYLGLQGRSDWTEENLPHFQDAFKSKVLGNPEMWQTDQQTGERMFAPYVFNTLGGRGYGWQKPSIRAGVGEMVMQTDNDWYNHLVRHGDRKAGMYSQVFRGAGYMEGATVGGKTLGMDFAYNLDDATGKNLLMQASGASMFKDIMGKQGVATGQLNWRQIVAGMSETLTDKGGALPLQDAFFRKTVKYGDRSYNLALPSVNAMKHFSGPDYLSTVFDQLDENNEARNWMANRASGYVEGAANIFQKLMFEPDKLTEEEVQRYRQTAMDFGRSAAVQKGMKALHPSQAFGGPVAGDAAVPLNVLGIGDDILSKLVGIDDKDEQAGTKLAGMRELLGRVPVTAVGGREPLFTPYSLSRFRLQHTGNIEGMELASTGGRAVVNPAHPQIGLDFDLDAMFAAVRGKLGFNEGGDPYYHAPGMKAPVTLSQARQGGVDELMSQTYGPHSEAQMLERIQQVKRAAGIDKYSENLEDRLAYSGSANAQYDYFSKKVGALGTHGHSSVRNIQDSYAGLIQEQGLMGKVFKMATKASIMSDFAPETTLGMAGIYQGAVDKAGFGGFHPNRPVDPQGWALRLIQGYQPATEGVAPMPWEKQASRVPVRQAFSQILSGFVGSQFIPDKEFASQLTISDPGKQGLLLRTLRESGGNANSVMYGMRALIGADPWANAGGLGVLPATIKASMMTRFNADKRSRLPGEGAWGELGMGLENAYNTLQSKETGSVQASLNAMTGSLMTPRSRRYFGGLYDRLGIGGTGRDIEELGGAVGYHVPLLGVPLPGRQTGGPVHSGQPYIVGESGKPEVFIPGSEGTIVPTDYEDLNTFMSNQGKFPVPEAWEAFLGSDMNQISRGRYRNVPQQMPDRASRRILDQVLGVEDPAQRTKLTSQYGNYMLKKYGVGLHDEPQVGLVHNYDYWREQGQAINQGGQVPEFDASAYYSQPGGSGPTVAPHIGAGAPPLPSHVGGGGRGGAPPRPPAPPPAGGPPDPSRGDIGNWIKKNLPVQIGKFDSAARTVMGAMAQLRWEQEMAMTPEQAGVFQAATHQTLGMATPEEYARLKEAGVLDKAGAISNVGMTAVFGGRSTHQAVENIKEMQLAVTGQSSQRAKGLKELWGKNLDIMGAQLERNSGSVSTDQLPAYQERLMTAEHAMRQTRGRAAIRFTDDGVTSGSAAEMPGDLADIGRSLIKSLSGVSKEMETLADKSEKSGKGLESVSQQMQALDRGRDAAARGINMVFAAQEKSNILQARAQQLGLGPEQVASVGRAEVANIRAEQAKIDKQIGIAEDLGSNDFFRKLRGTGKAGLNQLAETGAFPAIMQMYYATGTSRMFFDPVEKQMQQAVQEQGRTYGMMRGLGYDMGTGSFERLGAAQQMAGSISARVGGATWAPIAEGAANWQASGLGQMATAAGSILGPATGVGALASWGMGSVLRNTPFSGAIPYIGAGAFALTAGAGLLSRAEYMQQNPSTSGLEALAAIRGGGDAAFRLRSAFQNVSELGLAGLQNPLMSSGQAAATYAESSGRRETELTTSLQAVNVARGGLRPEDMRNLTPEQRATALQVATEGFQRVGFSSRVAVGYQNGRPVYEDRNTEIAGGVASLAPGQQQYAEQLFRTQDVLGQQLFAQGGGLTTEGTSAYQQMAAGVDRIGVARSMAQQFGGSASRWAGQAGGVMTEEQLFNMQRGMGLAGQMQMFGVDPSIAGMMTLGALPAGVSAMASGVLGQAQGTIQQARATGYSIPEKLVEQLTALNKNLTGTGLSGVSETARDRILSASPESTVRSMQDVVTEMEQGGNRYNRAYGSMLGMGFSASQARSFAGAVPKGIAGSMQLNGQLGMMQGLAGGNPLLMSMAGAGMFGGETDMSMITTQVGGGNMMVGSGGQQLNTTGLPMYTTNMQRGGQMEGWMSNALSRVSPDIRAAAMGTRAPGITGLQTNFGGMWGLQDLAADTSYNAQMASLGISASNVRRTMAVTTGEGVSKYKNIYAGKALPWSIDGKVGEAFKEGEGLWSLEDQGEQIQRKQQREQLGMQTKNREMQVRQYMETWDFNRSNLQRSFGWQQEDFAFQAKQTGMSRGWQQEDWSFNRGQRQMQFGWQMEDFEEDKRYSTGRQRRQIEKAQRRTVESTNTEEARASTMEGRQKQMWGEEDKRFETEKKRATETFKTNVDRMEMEKRHFLERMGVEEDAQKKQEQWMKEREVIEDKQRQLQRTHWLEGEKAQLAAIGVQAAAAKKQKEINELMTEVQRQQQLAENSLRVRQLTEVQMWNALAGYLNQVSGWIQSNMRGPAPTMPAPTLNNGGGGGDDAVPTAGGFHGKVQGPAYLVSGAGTRSLSEHGDEWVDVWPAGMAAFGKRQAGQGGSDEPIVINLMLDGQVLAKHTVNTMAKELYRGRRL